MKNHEESKQELLELNAKPQRPTGISPNTGCGDSLGSGESGAFQKHFVCARPCRHQRKSYGQERPGEEEGFLRSSTWKASGYELKEPDASPEPSSHLPRNVTPIQVDEEVWWQVWPLESNQCSCVCYRTQTCSQSQDEKGVKQRQSLPRKRILQLLLATHLGQAHLCNLGLIVKGIPRREVCLLCGEQGLSRIRKPMTPIDPLGERLVASGELECWLKAEIHLHESQQLVLVSLRLLEHRRANWKHRETLAASSTIEQWEFRMFSKTYSSHV